MQLLWMQTQHSPTPGWCAWRRTASPESTSPSAGKPPADRRTRAVPPRTANSCRPQTPAGCPDWPTSSSVSPANHECCEIFRKHRNRTWVAASQDNQWHYCHLRILRMRNYIHARIINNINCVARTLGRSWGVFIALVVAFAPASKTISACKQNPSNSLAYPNWVSEGRVLCEHSSSEQRVQNIFKLGRPQQHLCLHAQHVT